MYMLNKFMLNHVFGPYILYIILYNSFKPNKKVYNLLKPYRVIACFG